MTAHCRSLSRIALIVFIPAVIALALASTLPALPRTHHAARGMSPEAFDASRKVLFVAQGNDGAVRVLNLRNTIGEIGVLRSPQRHAVHDLKLDAERHRLWVLGDDAAYLYDADSLHLIERQPVLGSAGWRFARVDADSFTLEARHIETLASGVAMQ